MKTLVVNSQKGGVGRTMPCVHAAWFLAEAGAKVLIVDLDPQANAYHSLANLPRLGERALFFGSAGLVQCGAGVSLLAGHSQWPVGGDYCVIDIPPTWLGGNSAAL
jgi:chromosome partitioning protein